MKTLVTGAGGYLGQRIARRLLDTTDDEVVLWIHAGDRATAQAKRAPLQEKVAAHGDRVSWAWGALESEDPFGDVPRAQIGAIVHTAAIYRFNVDADTARAVNVEGTAKLLDFAGRCPGLQSFSQVSSLYATGLASGPLPEARLAGGSQRFANEYERSKHQAEQALFERPDLPWQICRVAMVVADDDSGRVIQYNAFHNTLKLFFNGLLSIVPGRPEIPLYFVTGAFAAEAICEIGRRGDRQTVFHVCHERSRNVTLGELVDVAFEVFSSDPAFKSRRLPRPLYTDAEAFDMLVEGVSGFGGDVLTQALASVAPFARQLFVDKDCANANLLRSLSCYDPGDMRALVVRTCEDLVRTRFGRLT